MKGCFTKLWKITLYALGGIVALVLIGAILSIFIKPKATQTPTATPTSTKQIIILVPTSTSAPAPATSTPVVPTVPAFLARCLDVPSDKIKAIATGLTVGGGGTLDAKSAQAVKSGDFKNVYFIAAAIHGQGMGDNGAIGIWSSNSLDPGEGLIFAVDAMAVEFSDWGPGKQTDAHLSQLDDGAQESVKCVQYKQGVH